MIKQSLKCYACKNIPEGHVSCSGHRSGVRHPDCLCTCVLYCLLPSRDTRQYIGAQRKVFNTVSTQHLVKLELSTFQLEPTPRLVQSPVKAPSLGTAELGSSCELVLIDMNQEQLNAFAEAIIYSVIQRLLPPFHDASGNFLAGSYSAGSPRTAAPPLRSCGLSREGIQQSLACTGGRGGIRKRPCCPRPEHREPEAGIGRGARPGGERSGPPPRGGTAANRYPEPYCSNPTFSCLDVGSRCT
jgi:hypothetical protein